MPLPVHLRYDWPKEHPWSMRPDSRLPRARSLQHASVPSLECQRELKSNNSQVRDPPENVFKKGV
jgi:hypothetical protein